MFTVGPTLPKTWSSETRVAEWQSGRVAELAEDGVLVPLRVVQGPNREFAQLTAPLVPSIDTQPLEFGLLQEG